MSRELGAASFELQVAGVVLLLMERYETPHAWPDMQREEAAGGLSHGGNHRLFS